MLERFFAFVGRHPRWFDGVVAVFFALISFGNEEVPFGSADFNFFLVGTIVSGLALLWRRIAPRASFGAVVAVVMVLTVLDVDDPLPMTILCASYSLAAHSGNRRHSIIGFASFLAIGVITVAISDPSVLPDAFVIVLMLSIAWITGDSLRTRRDYQQSVLERAERAEALRDSLAQQAVAEERTRIARDLHDVVAHSMSLMVVQAGAARRVAATDPAASVAAIEAIEAVGRNSLDEMRRILGVLRGEDRANEFAPQPDIAAIDDLVEEFASAGLPVTLSLTGDPRSLPPSIELTAYRIVQESLTNTLKHAGAATAKVFLDFEEDVLRIQVDDDGKRATPFLPNEGSAKGHVGMRERVAAFDGSFSASPRLKGGYQVLATIPIEAPAAADETDVEVVSGGSS